MVFALLSPSKTLSFVQARPQITGTMPYFQSHAVALVKNLKQLSAAELSNLMAISDKLAQLNQQRFRDFSAKPKTTQTELAILAFQGDTFKGVDAASLSDAQIKTAQTHIGILSGLYGLLQPLDLIQPYRLEMSTPLITGAKKNLYEFWGGEITKRINHIAREHKHKAVIGCASQEYFHAVQTDKLDVPFINCDFKEKKNGKYQTIAIHAKKARGMMARFIAENKIKKAEDLLDFSAARYKFNRTLSTNNNFVFTRTG